MSSRITFQANKKLLSKFYLKSALVKIAKELLFQRNIS